MAKRTRPMVARAMPGIRTFMGPNRLTRLAVMPAESAATVRAIGRKANPVLSGV